ncbi:hypothetical protein MNBD_BACTEROID03-2022 [hydrothermal vent metagenome]|uniref:Uncharacterized protein n=1 Tax=hydrothermal vent metagenome TaxID=652676 RepID=A0A3B0TJM2_9ZZZZ
MAIVVITGLFGVIIFDVNSFLLVLTLLSGYNGYSGFRVLHNKSNTPKILDIIIAYDLVRYAIPIKKHTNLWLYEHIYKMIAAFTALLAAATGTIYPDHKPYRQFLPSVFGTLLALGFILYFYRKSKNEILPKGI